MMATFLIGYDVEWQYASEETRHKWERVFGSEYAGGKSSFLITSIPPPQSK